MTTKPTREQRLEACLKFFASVIKSGEPWTSICETEYGLATEPEPTDHTRCHEVLDALNREISWLRDVHRHTIDQLVARYALVPPAPSFVIPTPKDHPICWDDVATVSVKRLDQLLAIEKAAKDIVDTEARQRARQGHGSVVISVADSQLSALADAVNSKDQP